MKKFFCAAMGAVLIGASCLVGGCASGEATVEYTLSEDKTHYIVSGVLGYRRALTEYTVPAEYAEEEGGTSLPVTEIGDEAFFGCVELASVTLPDTIVTIGDRAFMQCGFTEFTIPESVESIGYGAFGMCNSLVEITVPQSVTDLQPLAFAYCIRLERATVNANIEVLRSKVLCNSAPSQGGEIYTNSSLTQVSLPASLKKFEVVYDTAYNRYISPLDGNFIKDIYFAGTKEQWDEIYFYTMVLKEGKKDEYEEKKLDRDKYFKNVNVYVQGEKI